MNQESQKFIESNRPESHELPQRKAALRRFLMHEAAAKKPSHWKVWAGGFTAMAMILILVISPLFKNTQLDYQPYQKNFNSPQLKLMVSKKESANLYAQWKIQHRQHRKSSSKNPTSKPTANSELMAVQINRNWI